MPYATQRFVHLGWRVIRVEPTPLPGRRARGDPNRYIGRPVGGEDRHSYYVSPNAGKEAVALNLKEPAGRDVLRRLVRELKVDVFCTNTLPAHHGALGIDAATLTHDHPELIWAGISAMGTARPAVPGYDPMIQALCGYMDLTGDPDGPPMQCGPPVIDLKAGDEVFAQVLLALLGRQETGRGAVIDVSMAQVAVSWLHTFLPMLDMGSRPEEIRRSGNEHRQFIPVNAYPTADGFVYVAIGSDVQWRRFAGHALFSALDQERFHTNESRRAHKGDLHRGIAEITGRHTCTEVAAALRDARIPHAPISPIEAVWDLDFVRESALRTVAPDGAVVRLPPPAVPTAFLEACDGELPFAPAYGEQTDAVLSEAGIASEELTRLRGDGVIA